MIFNKSFGTGARPDTIDGRDLKVSEVLGAPAVDWVKGYDVEKELKTKIPFKHQGTSSSCVGNAWGYQVGVLDGLETRHYDDVSAKPFYSQIFLPQGGAYIRDGAKIAVNWGALYETIVTSYINGKPPTEDFMRNRGWFNEDTVKMARIMQAKEYRVVDNFSMDTIASAIEQYKGVVGGVWGNFNAWKGVDVYAPTSKDWGHALYFGKYGTDEKGKYIATPNSWGDRFNGQWQKIRENYFTSEFMFNPWALVDKPNVASVDPFLQDKEKKLIFEGEGLGRMAIVINGKLREIKEPRKSAAALYTLITNGFGLTISTNKFNSLPKDNDF